MRGSLAAAALAAALLAVPPLAAPADRLWADDTPPPKGPDTGKGDVPKEAKKDENLRVERAKQLVKELEESIARVKAAQPIDATLLDQLIKSLEQAKALAVPAKPAELTDAEKKAVVDEARK